MSQFYRDRWELPFNDLVEAWAAELSEVKPAALADALWDAALDGWFDDPRPDPNDSRHGIIVWHDRRIGDEWFDHLNGVGLEGRLERPYADRYLGDDPVESLRAKISLTRQAALTFAEHWRGNRGERIAPPSWWAPARRGSENPPAAGAGVADTDPERPDGFTAPYWNLMQVLAWVYLQDRDLVRRTADGVTDHGTFRQELRLPDGRTELVETRARPHWPIRLELEAAGRGGGFYPSLDAAQQAVLAALQKTRLSAWDLANCEGGLWAIPPVQWDELRSWLEPPNPEPPHAGPPDLARPGAARGYGLRFRRADVLSHWPERTQPIPRRVAALEVPSTYVPLLEVVQRVAIRRLDLPSGPDPAGINWRDVWTAAEKELRARLQAGDVTAFGLWQGEGALKDIPKEFWAEALFEPLGGSTYPEGRGQPQGGLWQKVRLMRRDVLALWPESTTPQLSEPELEVEVEPDPYRSGAPGRPSIMHLIRQEFERRTVAQEVLLSSLAAEAQALHDWAVKEHPSAPTPSAKAIKNKLREAYRLYHQQRAQN